MGHWKVVISMLPLWASLILTETDQVSTSVTESATLSDALPCHEELHIIALRKPQDTITVTWNPTQANLSMEVQLNVLSTDSDTNQDCSRNKTISSDAGQVVFDGCCPSVDYKVGIILRCLGVEKRYSVVVMDTLKNETTIPKSPKMVEVLKKTNSSITLTWQSFKPPTGISPRYKMQYETPKRYNLVRKTKLTNDTWITVQNLKPSTEYCFMVSVKLKKWKTIGEDLCTHTEEENFGRSIATTYSPPIEPCSTKVFQNSGKDQFKTNHTSDYSLKDGCNDTERHFKYDYEDNDFKTESFTTKSSLLTTTNGTLSKPFIDRDEIQSNVIGYRFSPKNIVTQEGMVPDLITPSADVDLTRLSEDLTTSSEDLTMTDEDLTTTDEDLTSDEDVTSDVDLTSNEDLITPNEDLTTSHDDLTSNGDVTSNDSIITLYDDLTTNESIITLDEDLTSNVSTLVTNGDLTTTKYRIISDEDSIVNESEVLPAKNLTQYASGVVSANNSTNPSEISPQAINELQNINDNSSIIIPHDSSTAHQSRILSVDEVLSNHSKILLQMTTESTPENTTPKIQVPGPPTNISTSNLRNTSVEVSWNIPQDNPDLVSHYEAQATCRTCNPGSNVSESTNNLSTILSKLQPYTDYRLTVSSISSEGKSSAEEIPFKTLIGIPGSPKNVTIGNITSVSLLIRWRPPEISNGPITKYKVTWSKMNESMIEPPSEESEVETNNTSEEIPGLSAYQEYVFWVSARTEVDWGPKSNNVTVTTDVDIPGLPVNITIENITSKSVVVKWWPPETTNGPITKYKVTWIEIDENNHEMPSTSILRIETNNTNAKIAYLVAYQRYIFGVSARTTAGWGPKANSSIITTDIDIPTPPENVKWTSTNTSITLTWNPPMYPRGPLEIIEYIVTWGLNTGNKLSTQDERTEELPVNEKSHEITELLPFTEYELQVCAQNKVGRSAWSFPVFAKTDVGIPGPPTNIQAISITNISMVITWGRPTNDTGPIEMYKVFWTKSSASKPIVYETKNLQMKMTSLTPFTDYRVKVAASTSIGWGLWSDVLNVTTAIGVPSSPENIKLENITNVTITVTWSPPSKPNGPILGYAVFWNESLTPEILQDTFITETKLTLKKLHSYRIYCFSVSAKTEVDFGQKSEVICARTDVGIPGIPQDPSVDSVTNISAVFTWNAPLEYNGPITNYTVRWKPISTFWGRTTTVVNATSETISDLDPYKVYCFQVSARTIAGSGRYSDNVCNQTEIGIPEMPDDFHPTSVTDNSISLQWMPPNVTNGPILTYSVTCKQDTSENITELETNETTIDIEDLLPYTQYKLSVRAATEKGWGPPSDEILIRTDVAVPEPAEMQEPTVLGPRSIQIGWVLTSHQFPGPTVFSLEVWKRSYGCHQQDPDKLVRTEDGANSRGQNLKTVTLLTPYTTYFFRVLVKTTAGGTFSNASSEVTTWPDIPGPPLNLKVNCTYSPTSAKVTFHPPDPPHGDITGYRITYSSKAHGNSINFATQGKCGPQVFLLQGLKPELPYWISVQAKVDHVDNYGYEARHPYLCTLPAGIPPVTYEAPTEASSVNYHELRLRWSRKLFSSGMGKVLHYAVIVGDAEVIGPSLNGSLSELIDFPPWFLFNNGTTRVFQATPPHWNPFEDSTSDTLSCERDDLMSDITICILGRNLNCSNNNEYNYCNGPLPANTEYGIKIRGFTKGGYSESQAVFAKTKSLPRGSAYGGLIAGVIVLLACLTAATCTFLVFKKHPERWKQIRRALPLFQKGPSLQFIMEQPSPSAPAAPEVALVAPFSRQFELKDFLEHVKMMTLDSSLRFSLEFDELKVQSPRWPCTSAEMEENRLKNRWMNIFPFDHSRVKLLPIDDEPGSDFVNASFIPGFNSQREYIASQGPLKNTVDDFWRMVWEQNVAIIVMLTQCVERGKNKCEQYWPSNSESQIYGDLKVQMLSESILEAYIIRIFVVQLGDRERRLKQMHFTRWPDFGSPEKPNDLINFVRATREHMPRNQKGPILVHCSAGVGRTGTFITVDRLMQHLQQHQTLDVYETVLEMRQHRTNMVQTEDQYIYIHKCMREIILEKLKPPIETVEATEGIYSNVLVQKDTKV